MDKNDKIELSDLFDMDAPESKSEKTPKTNKEEVIINAFTKNPGNPDEALQYLKDKEQKIEKKLESETDAKKGENLQKMLDDLNKMGVELYEYNKRKPETKSVEENVVNETPNESKKVDNKVISIFTKKGESVEEEVKPLPFVSYQGSMKVVEKLPDIESEKKEKIKVSTEGEVKKVLPKIEEVKSKEKKPNPSLQELANRVKKALVPLTKEEQEGAMTPVLVSLITRVKNNEKNIDKSLSDSVFQNYLPDIEYIEGEAKRIKESK
jgi:hypothetical protein